MPAPSGPADLPLARGALDLLPLYEEIVTTGAWWDHVDGVAPRVRDLLLAHPATMTPLLREWARSPDRWLRRSAVIAQLGARTRTDTALLTVVVEVNAADLEFFVRRAIGWALPDFDRTDPDRVRRFLADHELSPLSRREAAKHLGWNRSAGATLLPTSSVDVPAGTRSRRRA